MDVSNSYWFYGTTDSHGEHYSFSYSTWVDHVYVDKQNIRIATKRTDANDYSAYVTVRYTKTTEAATNN